MKSYLIRIGNGNDGTYPCAVVQAPDAFAALRKGTRKFGKPWDVRHRDAQGDDDNASLCSYVRPIYGDACRWVMVAEALTAEDATYYTNAHKLPAL